MVGLPPALLCGSGDPEERDMRFILASALVVVSLAGRSWKHGTRWAGELVLSKTDAKVRFSASRRSIECEVSRNTRPRWLYWTQ
jgi:hypothetical protein